MKFIRKNPYLAKLCTTGAAALALGIFSASTASAQVVIGLDNFDSSNAPTVPVLAPGVTATATASATGGTQNWSIADSGGDPGRGSSDDGTWGTFSGGIPASTVTNLGTANMTLTNAKPDGEITITITNGGASDLVLNEFNFDAVAFRPKAARTYELEVLSGDITNGIVFTSGLPMNDNSTDAITHLGGGLSGHNQHDQIDLDLTGLADNTLEVSGTVVFQLRFTEGAGDNSGGHHLFVDNIAVTTAPTTTNKLAVTSVPASSTAGVDFSVTVQAQDSGGTPINVTQNTDIVLNSSGTGGLTGNTGTILAGTNSVTLTMVNTTVAETINLTALKTSGDDLVPSAASLPIDILPDVATDLFIETAADGSGDVVPDTFLLVTGAPFQFIDVFAITRDVYGNFVANDAGATFSLVNIMGDVDPLDLTDNLDGSALYEAIGEGTCNIRVTLTGFTDADSGLITSAVDPPNIYDDGGGNSSWQTAANWVADIAPFFDNTTDLFFADPGVNSGKSTYMGADATARSLNYNADVNGFNIRTTTGSLSGIANLTLDTDSGVDPAEINVDASALGNFKIGNISGDLAAEFGNLVLADDLKITHLGVGELEIDATISESGGSFGITIDSTSTGLVDFSAKRGANTYTGATTVNGGTLQVNGDSIPAALVIDGTGLVEVEGTEYVSSLQLGGGAVQTSGTFDATTDPTWISGTGMIIVGTPPSGGAIAITDVENTAVDEITLTFSAGGNVDIYRSTDPSSFGGTPYATDQPAGTYVDTAATDPANYYRIVITGAPAP